MATAYPLNVDLSDADLESDSDSDNIEQCCDSGSESVSAEVYSAVKGYQFEPKRVREAENNTSDAARETETDSDRVGNTDWCTCNHCLPMTTAIESQCCQERPETQKNVEEYTCLTEHPGFDQGCLNQYACQIAYLQYRQQYGGLPELDATNQPMKYRYIAYRQVVRWCWGYLGKHRRVPLPSCVVNSIRSRYPAPADADYTGFHWPRLD